jgi:hypothetical protein
MNPINLTGTETVEAIAVLNGYTPSQVASATYIINSSSEALTTTLSPTSLTLAPGASGTINIAVAPQNGINAVISFQCTGLPMGGTCAFNPATLTTGPTQAPVSTVLTVTAPTTVAGIPQNRMPFLPGATLAAAACLIGWRKRRGLKLVLLLAALSVGLGLASGCGSSNNNQTSQVTVAISGDSVRNTATFTLNY